MTTSDGWTSLVARERLSMRSLDAGETLFRQGDPPTAIHVVRSGRVRLLRHLEDGSSVALHVAGPGDSLAEASLWSESYHCDAIADIPSTLVAIPKRDLLDALERNGADALKLARVLATQVRALRSRLELRNIRSGSDRVPAWLRLQADGTPPTVTLDRPWKRIAEEIGLTHESIYRALATLQAQGRILREPASVVLISLSREGE